MAHELTHTVQQGAVQQTAAQQNDTVQRASNGIVPPTLSHGAQTVQRFSIDDPDIDRSETVKAKRSAHGADGVIFVEDASNNTVVIKANADPIGETHLANIMHKKVSGAKL